MHCCWKGHAYLVLPWTRSWKLVMEENSDVLKLTNILEEEVLAVAWKRWIHSQSLTECNWRHGKQGRKLQGTCRDFLYQTASNLLVPQLKVRGAARTNQEITGYWREFWETQSICIWKIKDWLGMASMALEYIEHITVEHRRTTFISGWQCWSLC